MAIEYPARSGRELEGSMMADDTPHPAYRFAPTILEGLFHFEKTESRWNGPVALSVTGPRPIVCTSGCDPAVVVAVVTVWMMQVTGDQVVRVIPVRNGFVAAIGAMLMPGPMVAA